MEFKKIKDVAVGYGYTVFATSNNVYATGLNKFGQIGYFEERPGHPVECVIVPQEVQLPLKGGENIARVECGLSHTLVLTDKGRVLALGSNAFGQCGRPVIEDEDYFRSKIVHDVKINGGLDDDQVVDLECGLNHSMFLSKEGRVHSCGWGADGQTGLRHYDNEHRVTRIEGDISKEKIVKIASSADNVLALNGEFIFILIKEWVVTCTLSFRYPVVP